MNSVDFFENFKKNMLSGNQLESQIDHGFLVLDGYVLLETGWYELSWVGVRGTVMFSGTTNDKKQFNLNLNIGELKIPITKKERAEFNKKKRKAKRKEGFSSLKKKKKKNSEHEADLKFFYKLGLFTYGLTKEKIKKSSLSFFLRTKDFFNEKMFIYIPDKYMNEGEEFKGTISWSSSEGLAEYIVQRTKIKGISEMPRDIQVQLDYWSKLSKEEE